MVIIKYTDIPAGYEYIGIVNSCVVFEVCSGKFLGHVMI